MNGFSLRACGPPSARCSEAQQTDRTWSSVLRGLRTERPGERKRKRRVSWTAVSKATHSLSKRWGGLGRPRAAFKQWAHSGSAGVAAEDLTGTSRKKAQF